MNARIGITLGRYITSGFTRGSLPQFMGRDIGIVIAVSAAAGCWRIKQVPQHMFLVHHQ
jgi:hypothetical protein